MAPPNPACLTSKKANFSRVKLTGLKLSLINNNYDMESHLSQKLRFIFMKNGLDFITNSRDFITSALDFVTNGRDFHDERSRLPC